MSLDKFVARGFTASTGGGLDSWVSKSSAQSGSSPTSQGGGSGTSFVMGGGGGNSSRAGSSRSGEAFGSRGSLRSSHAGPTRGGDSKSSGSSHERRGLAEDLFGAVLPQFDPKNVAAVLTVLALVAVGYLFLSLAGITQGSEDSGNGRAVQSEILERRSRIR